MDIKDKNSDRIKRMQLLLDTHFDSKKDDLGKFLGYKDGAFVRQMLSGSRPISEKTIDRINSMKKFENWFSVDDLSMQHHSAGTVFANKQPDSQDSEINAPHNDIILTQYCDVAGSMGRGLILQDQPGEISSIRVNEEWVRKNVKHYSSIQNLCIVTGFGDSMRGMYNPGDPLLVDSGVKSIDFDGVYFFRIGDEGFIKTLQRIPGVGIRAISENTKYEAWTITKDMQFEILARVIKVWESTDF